MPDLRFTRLALTAFLCLTATALADTKAAQPDSAPWIEALRSGQDPTETSDQFSIESDWLRQDADGHPERVGSELVAQIIAGLPAPAGSLLAESKRLKTEAVPSGDPQWLRLYAIAAEQRRAERLKGLLADSPKLTFIKRRTIRPSFFAYTEGQSDAQSERTFLPGSELCLLEFDGTRPRTSSLLSDPDGVIRDPAVSWDGKRIAFAWKKSLNDDDYHLYELETASKQIRQLTFGKGVADYEPCYLPNGDFIFSSSRCVQTVDCFWTEVSNLYTSGPDGQNIRRLGFDQVHTVFPQLLDDGRVIYTRWDYNDRGQVFPQPLFQMNPDGTNQTEFYGNNSWFPTTIAHARGIPGSGKVLAILCGHHTSQAGKLAIIDPSLGRQENHGVQLVSPIRETKAERIDAYGQQGELFCYPYPLNECEWLVSYAPDGWEAKNRRKGDAAFAIYWMDADGHRELLTSDPEQPCQHVVPLRARPRPHDRASQVDLSKDSGSYYIQDIYQGPGLAGIPRGSVKKLRVVALEFRAAGIGANHSGGPGGSALISTPIAIGNGAWDVKRILGETTVHEDGSAYFIVPARTPVYFQAVDERGHVVQTMRSWSTLQPGENQSCVGCHEEKNSAPTNPNYSGTLALQNPAQALTGFHGPPRGFSFPREIQPILDRHCIRCHDDRQPLLDLAAGKAPAPLKGSAGFIRPQSLQSNPTPDHAFSLLGETILDSQAKRQWSHSYLALTQSTRDGAKKNGPFRGDSDGRLVKWISSQSVPTQLPPYSAGAAKSELIPLLESGHGGVLLSKSELELIACWIDLVVPYCADYQEANSWTPEEAEKYRRFSKKRAQMESIDRTSTLKLLKSR